MPTFSIQTPGGKTLDIEAPDEATAMQGAQQWHAENQPKPSANDVAYDMALSGGTGVVKGAIELAGLKRDASDAFLTGAKNLANWGADKAGITLPSVEVPSVVKKGYETFMGPTSQEIQQGIEGATGKFYEPKTWQGQYADKAGRFLPGAMIAPGGSVASNALRYALAPAIATQYTHNNMQDSWYKPYAEVGAGLAASSFNPLRIVTPNPASPTRQAMVDTLRNEGVTSLTAGQKTGNPTLQYLEDATNTIPFAGHKAAETQAEGRRQFTEAAARRAGTGPDASPEVLQANYQRLGQQFEDLSARNTLNPDSGFLRDLNAARRDYANVPPSQQRAIVDGYIDDIANHVRSTGNIPGPAYQEMRSRLSRQSNALRQSDPTLADALRGIRDSLDNAMNRSIHPDDAAAWAATRREYGAQKVLEKAASKAGAETAEGQISPANLRNTVSAENRGAYARGQGDFNDLARAGTAVLAPLPNSGTAQRGYAMHLLGGFGGTAGALLGGGIPEAGLAAAAGASIPPILGRALMSDPVQAYLANQLINGNALPASSPARNLLIARLLQSNPQALNPPAQPGP